MILDADLTMPPEQLSKFWQALRAGKGEFVNGSRLVYPMEDEAMRFLNLIANKMFSYIFSWLLSQRFTDTLCGTKVLRRSDYLRLKARRSYFGDFDPFGDFDLISGRRRSASVTEVPVHYASRPTAKPVSRFRHGFMLLRMVFTFGALRLCEHPWPTCCKTIARSGISPFSDWSTTISERITARASGMTIEIAAGSATKQRLNDVVATDIQFDSGLDCVADAQYLPFATGMVDVLRHIEFPIVFFREAERVLRSNGRLIMVEPAITWGSTLFYRLLHPEPVRTSADPFVDGVPDPQRDPMIPTRRSRRCSRRATASVSISYFRI
jgi:hypothetical protein